MRVYHIALFFAAIGAMSGIMNYIMVDAPGDNWFDQNVGNLTTVTVSEGEVQDIQFDGGSGIVDQSIGIVKYFNIVARVLQGVFLITSILDDFLAYDVGGGNLFAPVLVFFQILVYVIYIIGGVQFIMNRSMKGME